MFSSNITEAAGKKDESQAKGEKNDDAKSQTGSLFNFSNQATAGLGSGSIFGSGGGSSLFGGSGLKFQPTATTGGAASSSVFSGSSLFGGPAGGATGGGLLGGPSLFGSGNAGGTLFSNQAPLFGGKNSLFGNNQAKDGEEGDSGDDAPQEDNDEPPAFSVDGKPALIPGVTDKPAKLNIESRPPEKSPYTKAFVVSSALNHLFNCIEYG